MYAFEQDVPINAEIHAKILEALGIEPPDGLILHLALENPDGTLHYVDVWRSQAECDRFTEERLHPVVGQALKEHGIRPDAEPERRPIQVVGLWSQPQFTPSFP